MVTSESAQWHKHSAIIFFKPSLRVGSRFGAHVRKAKRGFPSHRIAYGIVFLPLAHKAQRCDCSKVILCHTAVWGSSDTFGRLSQTTGKKKTDRDSPIKRFHKQSQAKRYRNRPGFSSSCNTNYVLAVKTLIFVPSPTRNSNEDLVPKYSKWTDIKATLVFIFCIVDVFFPFIVKHLARSKHYVVKSCL